MVLPCINNDTSYQRTLSGKQGLCCEFGNLNPTIELEETVPAHLKMKCSSSKRWQKVFIKNGSKISLRTPKMSYVFISSLRYNGLFIYLFICLFESQQIGDYSKGLGQTKRLFADSIRESSPRHNISVSSSRRKLKETEHCIFALYFINCIIYILYYCFILCIILSH